jgi:hypothetical protein
MGDILHHKCGLKVMNELVEWGLVKEIECIVLRYDELDHMVDKSLR